MIADRLTLEQKNGKPGRIDVSGSDICRKIRNRAWQREKIVLSCFSKRIRKEGTQYDIYIPARGVCSRAMSVEVGRSGRNP